MNQPAQKLDVLAAIKRQKAHKKALRIVAPIPRKPRKVIKQADVDAAVNATFDALDREFRRLGVEFPKFRNAYDTARVVVQNARKKP